MSSDLTIAGLCHVRLIDSRLHLVRCIFELPQRLSLWDAVRADDSPLSTFLYIVLAAPPQECQVIGEESLGRPR